MVAPLVALALPVLTELAKNGLGLLAGAIQAKGKEVIEERLGIKLPEEAAGLTPEKILELKRAEMQHEEFLTGALVHEKELDLDAEKVASTQVTERWRADMSSDSWLSKNIRPLCLVSLLGMLFLVLLADAVGLRFQERTTALLELALQIVLGAYFIGRSIEKGIATVQEHLTQRAQNGH